VFLKTLTLKGFKSFADPTTIELEPGITVVVGPNGSGKSNVVDAVAWVLGAQGPKVVRSTKMDDVIFAGTSKRPALGRAEVSLTIDNGSKRLPLEVAEVTITRTLFRTGESEYAINGAPCRLLDVQELLSDAGVGRQQHVIMGQGQLDTVLQARPEDRRMIIEEAAGVLKFRRRRERSERRLESSEQNLVRLQDLQREVHRQLRPLERQAEAARRHDGLVAELRSLRVHLAGRELAALRQRVEAAKRSHGEITEREAGQRNELARLDDLVISTESALSEAQAWDGADRLARAERLSERQRGLSNVVTERRRAIAASLAAAVEADVVASLEAESSRLVSDLEATQSEADSLVPEQESLDVLEADLRRDEASFDPTPPSREPADRQSSPEVVAPLTTREARQSFDATRARTSAARESAARLAERLEGLQRVRAEHTERLSQLAGTLKACEGDHEALRLAHDDCVVTERAAESHDQRVEAHAREASDRAHGLEARAEALQTALDETRARAGVERLAGLRGVLGTLADLVDIDSGCERAFEAAVEDVLGSVVVDGTSAARDALSHLRDSGLHGGVLPTGGPRPAAESTGGSSVATPELLRASVRSAVGGVDEVLDQLLAGVVLCRGELADALDLVERLPDHVVVTTQGDRFSARGWRLGAARSGATRTALDAVRTQAEAAVTAANSAEVEAQQARDALVEARAASARSARDFDKVAATLTQTQSARKALEERLGELESEIEQASLAVASGSEALGALQGELALREAELVEAEGAEGEALAAAAQASLARRALEERARQLAASRSDLKIRQVALAERKAMLLSRQGEVERRLAGLEAARAGAGERRVSLQADQLALDSLGRELGRIGHVLETECERLASERRQHEVGVTAATERLRELRNKRGETERALSATRELLQRAELERAEARLRDETAVEVLRRELECEPEEAMVAPCPELPAGIPAQARVRELDRELRLMGPVNALALEELATLEERERFLAEQLEDVRGARRELGRVIRAVDQEIVGVFTQAFADVCRHFETLFEMLFPGGSGQLSLVDPEDLLSTGIEIEARPAGRNVRRLSLLSGGERSLVALAFLFAVFRSRPSPFYVMDEVEAALDDVNLHRFLELVEEFRSDAQLIIVSHQKRTMEAADVLYGVTMQPGGTSKVVSERVSVP
jgi:chromosome segregation protein